ncbi:plasmid multimer resolution protein pmrA [Streptomonospora alba]|uniref:Plasmid multimer resolution protein pmrA n=1 Tax=Streptomonospora alba TaxID=183763 RepID=A0A0C2JCM9_9ACTN|nr:site-specific integrase [Streptomonospora alba]KIH96705.1 plasmid multimer resolution protein pmrA [Streptomonospora alba]
MFVHPLPRRDAPPLGQAAAAFLERFREAPTTRRTYAETLDVLAAAADGPDLPVDAAFTPEAAAAAMARWEAAAPSTWNKHLAALRSFAAYGLRQEWLAADPTRFLERRRAPRRGDRSVPAARLEALLADTRHELRERVLWRMLYETAARAEEVLTLDVADLDPAMRRARIHAKGGAVEYVHWATPTARLLPRLLAGRTSGPVFLADRRSPAAGSRARALADVDPATGRGRLSYPRAEYLFKQASKRHDPHGDGWTLHRLRHSALTHLAEAGRSAAELQAKSRHQHLATLGKYVRLGEETAAAITAEHDPHRRR